MSTSVPAREVHAPVFEMCEPRLLLDGTWLAPATLATDPVGTYCDVALGDNGTVYMVYYDPKPNWVEWDADLVFRASDGIGSGSGARLLETGDEGKWPSIALDASNKAHISYYDVTDGDLRYVTRSGSWGTARTVDSGGDVGEYTQIALDGPGNPHIVYYDRTNSQLKYAWYDGSSWNTEAIAPVGQVWLDQGQPYVWRLASLAVEDSGRAHVSYYDHNTGDLMYAVRNKAGWDIETVESDGVVGPDNALVLDAAGRPHIAYFDSTDTDLHYAVKTGSTWDIQTVNDTAVYAGAGADMVLDGAGYPHISYKNQTADNLGYACFDGTDWHLSTPDTETYTGKNTSLSMDSAGNVAVTYYRHLYYDKKLKLVLGQDFGNTPAPDLAAVVSEPAGGVLVPGERFTVSVTVVNVGTLPAVGPVQVELYRSEDTVFDQGDDQIDGRTINVNLAPGEATVVDFQLTVPGDASPGDSYMVGKIEPAPAVGDLNDANNQDIAADPSTVAWKFGPFDPQHSGTSLTVMGAGLGEGEVPVTFSLTGGGTAEIIGGDNFDQILITGATPGTVLKISTPGGMVTSIGDIIVQGSAKAIDGRTVLLRGNVTVTGTLGALTLMEVADHHLITIGAPAPGDTKTALTIKLGPVSDTSIHSGTPIKSLTVTEWLDDGGTIDEIIAPWIGKIASKGAKANAKKGITASAGDFEAGLTLDPAGFAPKATLGSASIVGNLQGAEWDIIGQVGKVAVRGMAQNVAVRSTGSMGGVAVGAADQSDFLAGVKDTVARHPGDAADFQDMTATIKSFKVAGLKVPKGQAPPRYFFRDSNVSAPIIGSVSLLNVEFANGDNPFGVWACDAGTGKEVKSVKWADKADGTKGSWPAKDGSLFNQPDMAIELL
ncbi:MAG TPA: CARDB domain-containing protein [Phycisphaerae bacterium]|nr:CARDB domain-containing protein [Phycisphaerae bacterium]